MSSAHGEINVLGHIHPNEIMRCRVGSTLYGTKTADSDTDFIGIMVEPADHLFGLAGFSGLRARTAPDGVKSGPDDIDINVHGLKKWMHTAIQGNPNFIELLYAPTELFVHLSDVGEELIQLRDQIVSERSINKFLGYMRNQRVLSDAASQIDIKSQTKAAAHSVRLGHQCLELATRGTQTFPLPQHVIERYIKIRTGEISVEQAMDISLELEDLIENQKKLGTALRKEPNIDEIQVWMRSVYLRKFYNGS